MDRAEDYLKKPYARLVVPETDGSFRAEILEFPGCVALGDTAAEALSHLEDVAADWIDLTLAKGQKLPEPTEESAFSGKTVVRLPKSLHRKASYAAERDGVSLNQFIVSAVAEQVGGSSPKLVVTAPSLGYSQFYQQNNFLMISGKESQTPNTIVMGLPSQAGMTTYIPWKSNA